MVAKFLGRVVKEKVGEALASELKKTLCVCDP